jgi:hypothetical protein
MADLIPIVCPWCKKKPSVFPKNPKEEGNAWGEVRCMNGRCPAQPSVGDGSEVADNRGSHAYKQMAIKRWNKAAQPAAEGR